ncbi:MAG: hypothetical protein NC124_18795 [Clostridium sp.]|nr:hypothetical protein [Clostridium sp.]
MLNMSVASGTPDIWQEVVSLFEGTWFQSLVEKLSGIGFFGELIVVVLIMVLTAVFISVLVSAVRGCTFLFRKTLAYTSGSRNH